MTILSGQSLEDVQIGGQNESNYFKPLQTLALNHLPGDVSP